MSRYDGHGWGREEPRVVLRERRLVLLQEVEGSPLGEARLRMAWLQPQAGVRVVRRLRKHLERQQGACACVVMGTHVRSLSQRASELREALVDVRPDYSTLKRRLTRA